MSMWACHRTKSWPGFVSGTSRLSLSISEPEGAPQNVDGHNSSSTNTLVTWNKVPVEQQNGINRGYIITYQSQRKNHNANVSAGPSNRQQNITGLKEYVFYNITMFSSSLKGDGPHGTPVVVVRTDQDSELSLRLQRWRLTGLFELFRRAYMCNKRLHLKIISFISKLSNYSFRLL